MTDDYKRHGTTTLFAALEILQGKVIGRCYQRHRHQEFLKFLRTLEKEFPGEVPLHQVMDNYGSTTRKGVKLVENAIRASYAFCTHQFQLAESGGALVRRVRRQGDSARRLP